MTYFVVKTDVDLPDYRNTGIVCAIQNVPGVVMICNLELIDADTLAAIMMSDHPAVEPKSEPAQKVLF